MMNKLSSILLHMLSLRKTYTVEPLLTDTQNNGHLQTTDSKFMSKILSTVIEIPIIETSKQRTLNVGPKLSCGYMEVPLYILRQFSDFQSPWSMFYCLKLQTGRFWVADLRWTACLKITIWRMFSLSTCSREHKKHKDWIQNLVQND